MQPDQIQSLAEVEELYRQWGWIGAAAGAVYLLLRLWRSGIVDQWLNVAFPKMQWDARSRFWKLGAIFVLSAVATTLSGMATGQLWWSSAIAGLIAAVSAIGIHETKQTIGKAAAERQYPDARELGREEQSIRTRLGANPDSNSRNGDGCQ